MNVMNNLIISWISLFQGNISVIWRFCLCKLFLDHLELCFSGSGVAHSYFQKCGIISCIFDLRLLVRRIFQEWFLMYLVNTAMLPFKRHPSQRMTEEYLFRMISSADPVCLKWHSWRPVRQHGLLGYDHQLGKRAWHHAVFEEVHMLQE